MKKDEKGQHKQYSKTLSDWNTATIIKSYWWSLLHHRRDILGFQWAKSGANGRNHHKGPYRNTIEIADMQKVWKVAQEFA